MERMKVRELMRPIDEFPRIYSQAAFMEAVEALEKADQAFKSGDERAVHGRFPRQGQMPLHCQTRRFLS